MYQIEYTEEAVRDLLLLRKSAPQSFKKFNKLLPELKEHPYTGTGKPEQLKGFPGLWSRRLDKKNRLRYLVKDELITVCVVSALGHYEDK